MSQIATLVAVILVVPGAAAALHLGLMTGASLLPPRALPVGRPPPVRFLTIVPARNEAKVIGATLAALRAAQRPGDSILVVADGCTDDTAAIAAEAGALVLERGGDEPSGRAEARNAGIDRALALPSWDALAMVDADSVVDPGFFAACERALASGAEALQARSEAALGARLLDHAAVVAFAIQGVVLPRGRDRLGLLVRLRGTGMVLRRGVVAAHRFSAPASEDLWFSLDLCLDGIRPRHVDDARLRSLNASTWQDARQQRVRYEVGRLGAARRFAVPLLRRHDPASLEAAWFLLTPPVAVAVLCLLVGAGLAMLGGAPLVAGVAVGCLFLLATVVALALVEARAGLRTWCALVIAPWYLPWKALVQVRALLTLHRGVESFGVTPR